MASIAYEDSARTKIIYADSCTINEKSTRYYCENPDCPAHLYIRAVDSVLATHFYAPKDHPHVGWCHKEQSDFKPTDYSEDEFNYDSALDEILSPSKNPAKLQQLLGTILEMGTNVGLAKQLRFIPCVNTTVLRTPIMVHQFGRCFLMSAVTICSPKDYLENI